MSTDNKDTRPSFESEVSIAEQQIAQSEYLREQDAIELKDHEDYLLVEAKSIIEKRARKFGETLSKVDTVAMYFMMDFLGLEKEHFKIALLNTKHQLIHLETVSIGTVDSAVVYEREVAKLALEHNASALILAHNHPSGSVIPSKSDIKLTERLVKALALFDIRILDHLIVADDHYYSMCVKQSLDFEITKSQVYDYD